jgi:probable HAF family extracellular repeat protein
MAAGQQYTMVPLGFSGFSGSIGGYTGLNNNGDVVGYNSLTNAAFLYTDGKLTSLGLGYGDRVAIDNRGQVATVSSTSYRSYLYTPPNLGNLTDLGSLGGRGGLNNAGQTNAMALDDSGVVVGVSSYPAASPTWHAFSFANGRISDLGVLVAGGNRQARGINNLGQIVGDSWATGGYDRAFQMVNGTMTDMDPSLPAYDSYAQAINDVGQILVVTNKAWHQVFNGRKLQWVAYRGTNWYTLLFSSNGTSTDLGTLGTPGTFGSAMNRGGDVVGQAYAANGTPPAFLYRAGLMMDLNSHVLNACGLTLVRAANIDDAGQIICWGQAADGSFQLVVLSPDYSHPV